MEFKKEIHLKQLNLNTRNYQYLTVLINDENDFSEFMSEFWDEDNKFFAISDYRLHKIRRLNVSFEEFIETYHNKGEIEALEMLFQHPVVESDVGMINNKIKGGKLTLEKLFRIHKEEPGRHLLNILKAV